MKKKLKIKDIAVIGMLSAILLTVQVALRILPNIELVSLLIILYTLVLGRKALYIIYIFVLLEGVIYGFGLWWFNYLYIWTILYVIVRMLRKNHSLYLWSFVSGMYGLCFGALCSIPYFIAGGTASGLAYWVAGFPFDAIHGISNITITLILFKPLYYILNRLYDRTELTT